MAMFPPNTTVTTVIFRLVAPKPSASCILETKLVMVQIPRAWTVYIWKNVGRHYHHHSAAHCYDWARHYVQRHRGAIPLPLLGVRLVICQHCSDLHKRLHFKLQLIIFLAICRYVPEIPQKQSFKYSCALIILSKP